MSSAMCSGFVLLRAGQTSTQILQPVQSSGATWIVYARPCPIFVHRRQRLERRRLRRREALGS